MPALAFKPAALLATRDLAPSPDASISTTTIILIVFLAVVPVLIVAGVVIWLLGYYGRSGCCWRRDKENAAQATPKNAAGHETVGSEKTRRKSPSAQPVRNAPSRPPLAHTRDGSASSRGSSNEKRPASPKGFV
ncbi:hypothetical protein N0V90_011326 [Kalmusia sp. IMI 367209]|nr:hypothetical protein N0V90_011326 [Kalmusia sp. IMI 367209]